MAQQLDSKVALITGGSRGIGRAIVNRFRQEGAKVITCGRGQRPNELDAEIKWQQVDVSVVVDVKALADFISKTFGKPEDIANSALWLASDQSSFTSGQTFTIDGGLIAASPLQPGLF